MSGVQGSAEETDGATGLADGAPFTGAQHPPSLTSILPNADSSELPLSRRDSRKASKPQVATTAQVMTDGDARWEGMLQGLLDYQRKYSSLSVPRDYRWNNKNLYEWCRNNRKHFLNGIRGKTPALLPRRIKRLQEIGFELDPTGAHGQNDAIDDKRWTAMFDGLVDFHQRYGSFAVPIGYMCDGRSLHDWLRHQRKQYSIMVDESRPALSAARIDRLLSIGFDLDPTGRRNDQRSDQERWEVMFQGLQEFRNRHGTFVIPEGTIHDNRNLSSWAHNQRRLYANYLRNQLPTLLPERVEKLQSIGFVLGPRKSTDKGLYRSHDGVASQARGLNHDLFAQSSGYAQQGRHKLRRGSSAGTGQVSYTYSVTSQAERQAVSATAVYLASQTLTLYQAMTEQDRCNYLNRPNPQHQQD